MARGGFNERKPQVASNVFGIRTKRAWLPTGYLKLGVASLKNCWAFVYNIGHCSEASTHTLLRFGFAGFVFDDKKSLTAN